MSHVARIDLAIMDLDSLDAACKELGLELRRGQQTYKWYGSWVQDYHAQDAAYLNGIDPKDYGKCEHAIAIPGNTGAYEIGLVKNPNGPGWVLIYDFYGGGKGMTKMVGNQSCDKLKQAYAKAVSVKKALQLGYSVTQQTLSNGTVKLVLRR